ncbi:MAG: hypothetical protein F6K30_17245 [Cyanothece sp. SIO2G6]|nr:hypothetical protein [Cyanothece sp. SIO2G6]
MFGTFQTSRLRIEVNAPEDHIRNSLLQPAAFKQWLWPEQVSSNLPSELALHTTFTGWLGPISIQHHVITLDAHHIRLLLSEGIDGFHEWSWGDGWIQSCLEGVSTLPLGAGQAFCLIRLKQFLERPQ